MSDHDFATHLGHRHRLVSPFISPSDSMEFLKDLNQQSFREYLFSGLPMVVHPIIVLRLLAHRLFGNMIRRKTLPSDAKLKPPKVDDKMECPPRKDFAQLREDSRDSLSRRRKANLQLQITGQPGEKDDSLLELCETLEAACAGAGGGPSSSGSSSKPSNHNHVQSKNGSTKMAIKSMVESLVTPLDLGVISQNPEATGSPTQLPDPPDSASEVKPPSNTRTFFRWSSKKRLSKSHANVSSLAHRDSLVSQPPSSASSANDVDIAAFQRELINLPTFVMDTPPIDVSPVFSRCSSVPENLAGRSKSPQVGGSSGKLDSAGVETESEQNLTKAKFVLGGVPMGNCHHHGTTGSLVTITTTDMDYNKDESAVVSDVDSPADGLTSIVVHFEAPSSPQLSTSSQSPDAMVFNFPSIPSPNQPTMPTSNFLSPHQEYGASSYGLPGPERSVTSASTHTVTHACSPTSDRTLASSVTHKSSVVSVPCEVPVQHRGVLKVFETWVQKCHVDLDGNSTLAMETREFLKKLSVLGHEYKAWCQRMGSMLHLEVRLVKGVVGTALLICISNCT